MRAFVHYFGLTIGILGVLAFAGLRLAAGQYLDPDRSPDDRLTTAVVGAAARSSDFLPPGWQLIKLSRLAVVAVFVGALLWAVTGPGA